MAIPLRWPRLTTHSPVSLVIAHAPFGVARISPEMKFEAVNPRLGALLGAEPRDLVGTEVADVLLPDDRAIGLDLAERLPTVVGDPERLSQVIENLIRFAARCSIKGGRLDVCSAQRETAVAVFIRYVGNGQSIDFDNWLYGRYEPYENNPSIITGVGLGLAIARVIVERHAGEIWMESASLNSCELCFAIPARQAPAPAAI